MPIFFPIEPPLPDRLSELFCFWISFQIFSKRFKESGGGTQEMVLISSSRNIVFFTNLFCRIVREGCTLQRFWDHRKPSAILGSSLEHESETLSHGSLNKYRKHGVAAHYIVGILLYQEFTKPCPQTGSNSITKKLVSNVTYWVPPQTCWITNFGVGSWQSVFDKPSWWFCSTVKFEYIVLCNSPHRLYL